MNSTIVVVATFFVVLALQNALRADDSSRYGLFNLLDHNSKYNTNWFPEPLNSDEMDADQELRLNWTHEAIQSDHSDEVTAEIEKTFGMLTIELEVPYEREVEDGDSTDGIGNVEVAARHPVAQYVSANGAFDYTLGARVELAIATGSDVSKNTELVGALYQTIGIGEHFSIQMSAGYSTLFGPGEEGGASVLEYAGVFGYNFDINSGAIARLTPVFEIDGETGLNHGESGNTLLSGAAGGVIAFDSVGAFQPKIVGGYLFPLNDEARDESHWGFTLGLILEY